VESGDGEVGTLDVVVRTHTPALVLTPSTRFEKLLDGIDLSKHNAKMNKTGDSDAQSTSSHSTSMTPAQITPYPLVLKDSAQRVLLLLQFLNYAPLLPYLPANRTFSARELLTLLELADAYKLKDAPRATLRAYIARSAPALAMHVTEYADLKVLVSLVEASGCAVLARALFRLDWDAEKVLLLHLHHLAQPWDMPDDVIRDLPADIYAAFVYVETERAMAGGRLQDMSVSYSRSKLLLQ